MPGEKEKPACRKEGRGGRRGREDAGVQKEARDHEVLVGDRERIASWFLQGFLLDSHPMKPGCMFCLCFLSDASILYNYSFYIILSGFLLFFTTPPPKRLKLNVTKVKDRKEQK